MTIQSNINAVGMVVKSSYNSTLKTGYYKIYDLTSNELVKKRVFKNVAASDNVMAYLGIYDALKRMPSVNVYSTNNVAVIWAQNKWCNSKVLDKGIIKFIKEATDYLRCNDCLGRIHDKLPRI